MSKSTSSPNKRADLEMLAALERKVLWLSSWMIHNANHLRENDDGLKVGGHQASSRLARNHHDGALFRRAAAAGPGRRQAACQPDLPRHPVSSRQSDARKLEEFRGYEGAQCYPSRTKDVDDVDFSTGSVGLGVAQTLFFAR